MIKKLTTLTLAALFSLNLAFADGKLPSKNKGDSPTLNQILDSRSYNDGITDVYSVGDYTVFEIGFNKNADIFIKSQGSDKLTKITPDDKKYEGNSVAFENTIIYESKDKKESSIYSYNILTKETTLLVESNASKPSVTDDGKLYFIQELGEKRDAHKEVSVLDLKTKDIQVLTNTPEDEMDLEVSSNGDYLAVVVEEEKRSMIIELYNLDDKNSKLKSSIGFRPKKSTNIEYNQGVEIERNGNYLVNDMVFVGDSALVYKITSYDGSKIKSISDFKDKFNSWSSIKSKLQGSGFYLGSFDVNDQGDIAYLEEIESGAQRLYVQNIFDSRRKGFSNFKDKLFGDILQVPVVFADDSDKLIVYDASLKANAYEVNNPANKE
ncbi:MAG: hypothetical protein U9R00_03320 [Patescibacteria group bacterium]|nr:hypothetical protein [Patescibacteria group bacterium]